MTLTGKQRNHLRGLAHHQNPVVIIGNAGLSDAVKNEIDLALTTHELIKIKLPGGDREERQMLVQQICEVSRAEFVQLIGRTAVVYRAANEPLIVLPR
ncbi:MAG: ribosome assembly RNA-binding protein YhbY [Gammaproteobacteria bacterium]|nr:ribosome assembly RNA-binding protein YhbY [Gammaproteobacteria bacterium]